MNCSGILAEEIVTNQKQYILLYKNPLKTKCMKKILGYPLS